MKDDYMNISEVGITKNNSSYDRNFGRQKNKDRETFRSALKAQIEEDERTGKFKKSKNNKNKEDREL